MSDKQTELNLRIEEANQKINDLKAFAEANGLQFYLSSVDKEYYSKKSIENDSWLNEMFGHGSTGRWISSSDQC